MFELAYSDFITNIKFCLFLLKFLTLNFLYTLDKISFSLRLVTSFGFILIVRFFVSLYEGIRSDKIFNHS